MSNLRHEIATEHAVNAGAMGWAGCVRASLHAPERSQKPRNARDDRAPKGRPEGSRQSNPPASSVKLEARTPVLPLTETAEQRTAYSDANLAKGTGR